MVEKSIVFSFGKGKIQMKDCWSNNAWTKITIVEHLLGGWLTKYSIDVSTGHPSHRQVTWLQHLFPDPFIIEDPSPAMWLVWEDPTPVPRPTASSAVLCIRGVMPTYITLQDCSQTLRGWHLNLSLSCSIILGCLYKGTQVTWWQIWNCKLTNM